MSDPAFCPVPPGSTPLRELAHAIDQALTLPKPATEREELAYLRISRDRARLVRELMREILRDREIEDNPRDVMAAVTTLRAQVADLHDDIPGHTPATT
jgi:hypothetical protein